MLAEIGVLRQRNCGQNFEPASKIRKLMKRQDSLMEIESRKTFEARILSTRKRDGMI
jgi:hypothetical protein